MKEVSDKKENVPKKALKSSSFSTWDSSTIVANFSFNLLVNLETNVGKFVKNHSFHQTNIPFFRKSPKKCFFHSNPTPSSKGSFEFQTITPQQINQSLSMREITIENKFCS